MGPGNVRIKPVVVNGDTAINWPETRIPEPVDVGSEVFAVLFVTISPGDGVLKS
jgi:hypothetical protein